MLLWSSIIHTYDGFTPCIWKTQAQRQGILLIGICGMKMLIPPLGDLIQLIVILFPSKATFVVDVGWIDPKLNVGPSGQNKTMA